MTRLKKIFAVISAMFLSQQSLSAQNIIDVQDYDYWRELASTNELYMEMKADAIRTAQASTPYTITRDAMGANALAYILDEKNQDIYVKHIKENFETVVMNLKVGNDAVTSSVLSHELFFALLALDVIGDELDAKTLEAYQQSLESKIMKLVIGKWDPHAWAMRMLWYRYIGDEKKSIEAKKEWEIGLSEHFMPDGVSPAGGVYCLQRWTNVARTAKNSTLDVMEYMGYNEYYNNPSIIGLQEFLFGYANSPFGKGVAFGDSRQASIGDELRDENGYIISATTLRGTRFSEKANKYAMWLLKNGYNTKLLTKDIKFKGYLINYLIMAGTSAKKSPINIDISAAEMAPSRIFDNYAALISRKPSTNALYAAMQNLTGNTEYHTHYEVNAMAMVGYGEIILRNAGYDGPGRNVTVDGVTATFDYMHSMSESSNCVMLGGKQHTSKIGDGIVEGFSGSNIEYFRGSTGQDKAIEGCHLRDVVFMQPANGVNGYYIVMDHLSTNSHDEEVNVVWHPNSPKYDVVSLNKKYISRIEVAAGATGPQLYSTNEVALTTFLATEPSSIVTKKIVNQEELRQITDRPQTSYVAEYMMANYTAKEGKADILTVLFPSDKSHKTGEISRLDVDGYSGAKTIQNDIVDVTLCSDGKTTGDYLVSTFQGEDIVFRNLNNRLVSYFVKGCSFRNGAYGFDADSSLALHLEDNNGWIICSKESTVTFYAPQIKKVKLDGKAVSIIGSGRGWLKVSIPKGQFSLEVR